MSQITITNLTSDNVRLPGLGWMILPNAVEEQPLTDDILQDIIEGGEELQNLINESVIRIDLDAESLDNVLILSVDTESANEVESGWILTEDLCIVFNEDLDIVTGDPNVQ